MNGPRHWPPGTKDQGDLDIVDAEFEDIIPPEKVLRITYQPETDGSPEPVQEIKVPESMERTELEDGATVRITTQPLRPSKLRMKERTRGEKKAEAKRSGKSSSYDGDPHFGVPVVIEVDSDTRKEKLEALRGVVLKTQAQTQPNTPTTKQVIPLSDQTEEHLREVKSRLEARKLPGEDIRFELEKLENEKIEKLREFHKSRSALGRIAEQYTGELLPKDIKELMVRSAELRGRYLKETIGSIEARREMRGRDASKNEDVRERYQRRYEFERRMLIEPEEREIQAREEGLGSREKKALDTLYERYKELPAPTRILVTSGVMLSGGAIVGAGLGTGIGLTALAIGGMSAATRIASLYQKNKTVKGILENTARVTGIGGIVGLALEYSVRAGHKLSGTEKKAQETLERGIKIENGKTLNLGNVNLFKKLLADRKKAKTAKERVLLQARWARSVGSIGAGLAGGHFLSEALGGNNVEQASGNNTASNTLEAHANIEEAAAPVGAANAAEVELKVEPVVATIDSGEGFNKLFLDLRDSVDTRLHGMQDMSSASPVMKYLFETSPSELSDRIGAFDPETGKSMIMHEGDKLFLDDKGDLWFQKNGGEAKLLIENDPTAPEGFKVHDLPEIKVPELVASTASTQNLEAKPESESITSTSTTEQPEAVLKLVPETEAQPSNDNQASELPTSGTVGSSIEDFQQRAGDTEAEPMVSGVAPSGTIGRPLEDFGRLHNQDTVAPEQGSQVDTFTNSHSVEVTPSVPATYEWRVPGTNNTYTVAYGGSNELNRAWIQQELRLNPEARILATATISDPSTGMPVERVFEWRVGVNGEVVREEGILNPVTGRELVPPNPDNFTRKIR